MDISFVTRKIQRSIAGLSVLALLTSLVSFTGTAFANTFPDVDSSHFAYDYINQASDEGWMTGYENGYFGVDDYLTRDQATKILVLGFLGEDAVDEDYDAGFSDVSSSNSLENYINTAALYGIVSGYTDADGALTGVFGSGDYVNRAQFAKMVVEAAGLDLESEYWGVFPDVASGQWYTPYVETAYMWSVIGGYENGNYGPADHVTRGQSAKMVVSGMSPVYMGGDDDDDDDDDDSDAEATLHVELSDSSPSSMTIPSNATSVTLGTWDFTAEGGDVVIDNLTFQQYGIATLSSGHQVYLYNGNERLTSGSSINSSSFETTFTKNVTVEEGETVSLSVRMDMGAYTAAAEIGLEIESADKVDVGEAAVEGDFPAQAAKHTISTTSVGTVTVEKNGTVTNPQVGQDGATVAKFKISAATEGADLEELGVYLSGSVNSADVENFNLYVSGDDAEPLASVAAVDGNDVIRFELDTPYNIVKGGSKSFYMTADFNTGRTDDTVKFYVDVDTDVLATGDLYGFGMSVNRAGYDGGTDSATEANGTCTATTSDCSYMTLEGGDITITSDGPAASDVATNADDAVVLNFSIVSVTDVVFDSFPISMDTSSDAADGDEGLWQDSDDAANFTDVKITNTDTGSSLFAGVESSIFKTAIGGSTNIADGTDDAAAYHLYTDDFEMSAGEELNLALSVDIRNDTALDGMTFTAALDLGATYPQLKDLNNKTLTNSSVLVPTSAVTSKTMTVRVPTLALSLASTPTAGSNVYVKGTSNVQFSGLVFACGDASDCHITDLTLQGYYDDEGDANDFDTVYDSADHTLNLPAVVGSVSLKDGDGNVVAAAKGVNSSTFAVTYDSMDWTIDAGDTEIVYVTGNISTNATAQNVTFGISAASNVTVEDKDGNTFSATGTVNTTPTTYVTTTAGGTLTVAVSSSTARENIAIAGSSDVEISSFEITSTREAFLLNNLSLNNRQSAATTAALGDYDNNVVSVKISYENSVGATETKTAYLVAGTANFSGLDLYVPADDSATVTAYATLNSISSSGSSATAGEFVDLAMGFNNFEALAQSSGDTYKLSKLDNDTATLSIGTVTWTDGAHNINLPVTTLAAAGSNQTIILDNGAAATPANLPVGTLLCVSADTTCNLAAESAMVVTGWTEGTAWTDYDAGPPVTGGVGDTVTTLVYNDADTAFADDDNVVYSLPGTGYFTGTNQMVVYESKPTLALASSSPSGSRSVAASDDAFIFTVTADSKEKIQIRPSVDFPTCVAGTGATVTSATNTTIYVDGSSCEATAVNTSGDSVLFANTANLASYSYVSFWIRWDDNDANLATLLPAELSVATADANDGTEDNAQALAASNFAGSPAYLIENTWYLAKDIAVPSGTDSGDTFIGILWTDADTLAAGDDFYIDQFRVYNEKLEIDLSSDADFDKAYNNGSTTSGPVQVSLKESGNTVATGYVDMVAVPAAAGDGTEHATTDPSLAVVQFIPTSGQGNIEIAKGTTKTFTTTLSTIDLLNDDAGVDDPLTFSIGLGSSSSGTVTAGDFWWYETNATVRWLGNVSSTALNSNTVKY